MARTKIDWLEVEKRIRSVLKTHFTKKLNEGVDLEDTVSSLEDIDNIIWGETGRGSESDFAETKKEQGE